MIINCTKKLCEELKINPQKVEIVDPLFSWHANIIRVNRKKTIVLVNDSNRYTIVLYGLKAKHFKDISAHIINSIRETLIEDGIKLELVDRFIESSNEIIFSKTQNRTFIAHLNEGCKVADIYDTEYSDSFITQPNVSKKIHHYIYIHIDKEIVHPNQLLYRDFEKIYEGPIFCCKGLELEIRLNLEKFDIRRRVIVPLNCSFFNLHKVIKTVFDWKDYHMHDFVIFDGDEPIANIVSEDDEEPLMDITTLKEKQTKLCEFLPKYKNIVYTYDFGDNWEHIVQIKNILFDYDKNYPTCIDGNGDSPPEDVGGEGGFEEFVEIMKDPSHEDYKHMKEWAESQWYRGFDIEIVNRQLKYSIY